MRTGRVWLGAWLGLALLLSAQGLLAQQEPERLGSPTRRSAIGPATTAPDMGHGGHAEGHEAHASHEAHEEHESEGAEVSEGGLFFSADYLLVRPRRRPFDFVIKDPNTNLAPEGPVGELDWDTTSNYRLTAGYRLRHGWEVAGTYTYIHSHDDQGVLRDPNGSLYATLSAPIVFDSADGVRAGTGLDMDIIDVELAKRFEVDHDLRVRVAAGGRAITAQQKLDVAYDFSRFGLGNSIVSMPTDFDGVGIRVGGEGEWGVPGCNGGWGGLFLWAKFYSSLLTGDFRTSFRQTVDRGGTVAFVSEKFYKVVPVTELGVGIGWRSEHVFVRVAYELSNFFNMVDNIDFADSGSFKPSFRTGDLSLEALAFTVGVNF